MKQTVTTLAILFLTVSLFAQDDDRLKYKKAMGSTMDMMAEAKTGADYQAASNKLERIASLTPTEWAPLYYLAFTKTLQAFEAKGEKSEALNKELEGLTAKLENAMTIEKVKDNDMIKSEIQALIAMMYSARMSSNPMVLGPQFAPLNREHLGQAERLNNDNPRVYLLYAQNLFYTPEAFGGNKEKAKDLATKALSIYNEGVESEETFMPTWGKDQAEGLLKKMEEIKKEK